MRIQGSDNHMKPRIPAISILYLLVIMLAVGCSEDNPISTDGTTQTLKWEQTKGPAGGTVTQIVENADGHLFVKTTPRGAARVLLKVVDNNPSAVIKAINE